MIMAMWRGTVFMLADIVQAWLLNLLLTGKRWPRQVPNDEIRMPKLERMTNDQMQDAYAPSS
jgi:hypothetical protein